MSTVRWLLDSKGYDIWSISPDAPVYKALELLAEKDIGALVVMDGENLVGIVSERDYARKVALRGKAAMDTAVRDIMSADVISISPGGEISQCMEIMTKEKVRHVPVVEEGKVIGMITIGDVVKAIIDRQQFMIEQLEQYIAGGR
jgi:CBS domain-containing protein